MQPTPAGVWESFVPDVGQGAMYKYHLESRYRDYQVDKADPYGFAAEIRPHTASRVWNLEDYRWHDDAWMASRAKNNSLDSPISIYEVHLGSWRRVPEEGNRWLTYREWRLCWPITSMTQVSRTSSFSRSWSIHSMARGDMK